MELDELTTEARPRVHGSAWVAPSADVVGDVSVDEDASVWYGCVVRGDIAPVRVGRGTNIQDLSCVHVDAGYPAVLGREVAVGHRAIVHGCTVEDGSLIGMGAVVLSGVTIGAGSLVAAGAVVTEGTEVPPGSLVVGVPAKVVREVDDELRGRMAETVSHYRRLKEAHRGRRWAAHHGEGDR